MTLFRAVLCSLIVCVVNAQDTDLDRRVIEAGKSSDVSALDPQLPKARFEEWFQQQVGASTKVEWEANDCGEQDGANAQEDIPLCAEASAKLSGDRLLVVQIVVATLKKGVQGKPGLWSIAVLGKGNNIQFGSKLSDLTRLLRVEP